MKHCTKCKETKPLDQFSISQSKPDGLQGACKQCNKAYAPDTEYRISKAEQEALRDAHDQAALAKIAAKMRVYNQANPEKAAARGRAYRKANPAQHTAYAAKRRAYKLQATPAWANSFFIEEIYAHSLLLAKMSGVEHHVDHIVPLNHPLVCGLHTEHNLQVLTASDNQAKSNKHVI